MEPKIITQSDALSSASPWKTIILTGLLAGTLDAIAAIVVSQATPLPYLNLSRVVHLVRERHFPVATS